MSTAPAAAPPPGPGAPEGGAAARAPVAITGMGAVSALGSGTDALWRGLAEGVCGIRPIERFSTEGFSVHTAGMVPVGGAGEPGAGDGAAGKDAVSAWGEVHAGGAGAAGGLDAGSGGGAADAKKTADHALDFAIAAAREAVRSARFAERGAAAGRVAIVFGTSLATHPEGIHRLAEITADAIGARGPRVTISTACSSSANAIGVGRDLLLSGAADVVIAGGADALTEEIFAGFHNLGLLSPDRCAPFSEPPGTTLGEGAGFLVLERGEDAAGRGAAPVGWVSGYGLSCDAYHATSPDPAGAGVARAARAALADAGLAAADVDYVNAHGTGTETNDPAEWRGISAVLGEHAATVPVSATKSVLGHGQGAAGVLEILATLLAMRRGAIPQTLHHTRPRPRCPEDPVAQRTPRPHPVAHALCNSSAFGGANAIVVIDAPDRPAPARSVTPRAVRIVGAGLVLPGIGGAGALAALLGAGERRAGRITGAAPRAAAGLDLRGFDPQSRYLTFAAAEALRDAGLAPRGAARDRAGLFAALARISPASAHELDDSVKERGLLRLSAPAFTRVVLNAGPGACARALQLRGPTTTITTGDGGGLTALVMAAEHLALRDDADVLCVAAADEIDRDEPPERLCEAGACVVLAAADGGAGGAADGGGAAGGRAADGGGAAGGVARGGAEAGSPRAELRLAGWGIAGPGERGLAVARALARAGALPSEAPPPEEGGPILPARAAHPLLSAAVAIHRLRAGERAAVLLAHDGPSCATAVLLLRTTREK